MALGNCWGCRARREIYFTEEETGRSFCQACVVTLPPSTDDMHMMFLMATIPFKVGDRVECRTGAQLYDGIGTVQEISISLEHGGTPVYPTFRVTIDEKAYPEAPDEEWFTEVCLQKVAA